MTLLLLLVVVVVVVDFIFNLESALGVHFPLENTLNPCIPLCRDVRRGIDGHFALF